ncbi:MAG: adenosine-specific kinase [Leptolyngbyaceae cyanobacterium]
MELKTIPVIISEGTNLIIGQFHFIKTVEDLYEAIIGTCQAKFGLAFSEASGPCLIRTAGNDKELEAIANNNTLAVAAGHTFQRD